MAGSENTKNCVSFNTDNEHSCVQTAFGQIGQIENNNMGNHITQPKAGRLRFNFKISKDSVKVRRLKLLAVKRMPVKEEYANGYQVISKHGIEVSNLKPILKFSEGEGKVTELINHQSGDQLTKPLHQWENEIVTLKKQLAEANSKLRDKDAEKLSHLKALETKYTSLVENTKADITRFKKLKEEETKDLDHNKEQLVKERKQLDEKSEQLDQERKQLDEKSKQLDQERKQLDEERKQLDQEREQLEEKSKQLDQEREQLEEKSKQLDQEREQLHLKNLDKKKKKRIFSWYRKLFNRSAQAGQQ